MPGEREGAAPPRPHPEWRIAPQTIPYPDALTTMDARVEAVAAGRAPELIWLLEHPPLYTAGTSARPEHLLTPDRFPVYQAGRGGQFTYHGPGQRTVYLVLDLKTRGCDIRRYVHDLEEWLIRTLARFDIVGERRPGRVGVWVVLGRGHEAKIAALGVRVRRWISLHGVALNVDPDLGHYQGIVPCGIAEHGVTSLHALGARLPMSAVDAALAATWPEVFGEGRNTNELNV